MASNLIEEAGEFIGKVLNPEPVDYRPQQEDVIAPDQPEAIEQETLIEPEVTQDVDEGTTFETFPYDMLPDFGNFDFDIGLDDTPALGSSEQQLLKGREERRVELAEKETQDGTYSLESEPSVAEGEYYKGLRKQENGQKKGFKASNTGTGKFYPFESLEGTGPDGKIFSDQEIGYGTKIPKDWLGDDKSKWPVVDGVQVNVKDGFTEEQASSMMKASVQNAESKLKDKIKGFDDMQPWTKQYWTDLAYNGGSGIVKKNPKATKAANAGYTGESMIKTFDFINADGKKTRGLLNRRLNMYNRASLEQSGLPTIEEYEWGEDGIRVKFSSDITSDKVSKKFRDKINGNDGWYTVGKGGSGETGASTFSVDDDFKFN